jgi:hypothetical protein
MDPLQRFSEYAAEFEKTYQDDDWTRLEGFFDPNASYVVSGSTFDCELHGREAVLSGIKKAVDHFDRRFDHREIEPRGEPVVDGNRVVFPALVRYRREGVEPISFTLSETAEFDDAGRIVLLRDDYDPGQDHVARWLEANRDAFDPSYR